MGEMRARRIARLIENRASLCCCLANNATLFYSDEKGT